MLHPLLLSSFNCWKSKERKYLHGLFSLSCQMWSHFFLSSSIYLFFFKNHGFVSFIEYSLMNIVSLFFSRNLYPQKTKKKRKLVVSFILIFDNSSSSLISFRLYVENIHILLFNLWEILIIVTPSFNYWKNKERKYLHGLFSLSYQMCSPFSLEFSLFIYLFFSKINSLSSRIFLDEYSFTLFF